MTGIEDLDGRDGAKKVDGVVRTDEGGGCLVDLLEGLVSGFGHISMGV